LLKKKKAKRLQIPSKKKNLQKTAFNTRKIHMESNKSASKKKHFLSQSNMLHALLALGEEIIIHDVTLTPAM